MEISIVHENDSFALYVNDQFQALEEMDIEEEQV